MSEPDPHEPDLKQPEPELEVQSGNADPGAVWPSFASVAAPESSAKSSSSPSLQFAAPLDPGSAPFWRRRAGPLLILGLALLVLGSGFYLHERSIVADWSAEADRQNQLAAAWQAEAKSREQTVTQLEEKLRLSERDVGELDQRQKELAAEKARVEDQRAGLLVESAQISADRADLLTVAGRLVDCRDELISALNQSLSASVTDTSAANAACSIADQAIGSFNR